MADYFGHWLKMGKKSDKMPRIFHVNWFRKGKDGKFLWPGFGDNIRVLEWMFNRIEGTAEAENTTIGLIPKEIDLQNLDVDMSALFEIDKGAWKKEVQSIREYFAMFGDRLPDGIKQEFATLEKNLQ